MISNASDRKDRPASAVEAKERFNAHLAELAATTPRAGLGSATGEFIDGLIKRAARYGDHLFVCFDDPRIPATSNGLEGLFGDVKHILRHTQGCGSTTNTMATNLGVDVIIAFQQVRQPGVSARLRELTASPAEFLAARADLNRREAPAIRQRSMVRHLDRHIAQLRARWLGESGS